jgi:hypothetical protein
MSEELTNNEPQNTEVSNPAENEVDTTTTETSVENVKDTTVEETTATDYSNVNTREEASEVLESKGFDMQALSDEFQANGDLTPETRAKLAKHGFSEEVVDNFIQGQMLIVQKTMEDIASVVGGVEQMQTVVEWARANLPADVKASYDKIHDPVMIKVLLKDLERQMNDSEGYLPQQLQGGAGESRGNYFESMHEVEEAINDPRYSQDPAYRAKVAQKLTASREAGVLEIK